MPKITENVTTTKRRSVRARKTVVSQIVSYDFDEEEQQKRMPEGYNPSDDSEDEYVPPTSRGRRRPNILTTAQSKRRKKRSDDESSNSEEKSPSPAKKRRRPAKKSDQILIAAPSTSGRSSSIHQPRTMTPVSQKRAPSPKKTVSSASISTSFIKKETTDTECPMDGCAETLRFKSRSWFCAYP